MIKEVIEKEINEINHNRDLSPLSILTALNNAYTKIIPGIENQEILFNKMLEALIEVVKGHSNDIDNGVAYYRTPSEKYYSAEIKLIEKATGKKWEDV